MIKQSTVKEIAEGILVFLKKNNLQDSLPQLIEYLKTNTDENFASVYSPRDLSTKEKDSVGKMLSKLIGETPKKVNFYKDDSLVDGLKISYKDKMWDLSVRGQIGNLAKI